MTEMEPLESEWQLADARGSLHIYRDGRHLTSYRYGGEEFGSRRFRPSFFPLIAPCGLSVTEDAPDDHPHHHSLCWGHGRIEADGSEADVYFERENRGRIRHLGFESLRPDIPAFTANWEWLAVDPEGHFSTVAKGKETLLFSSKLSVRLHGFSGGEWLMDTALTLGRATGEVVLHGTNESGMPLLRPADALDEPDGGVLRDSEGRTGADSIHGSRAGWIDCSGRLDGTSWSGVAIFDHPQNAGVQNYPTRWFARGYGPLAPNDSFFGEPLVLEPGNKLTLRYGVLVHGGGEDGADYGRIQKIFDWYASQR